MSVASPTARALILRRRRQIALEQCWRDAQQPGVVVEPAGGILGREKRGGVDLERQQIANRIRVLSPIEAVQPRRTRLWSTWRRRVQRGFEPRCQCVVGGLVRSRHACGRHGAGAQLAHDLLPDLRVGRSIRRCRLHPGQGRRSCCDCCGSRHRSCCRTALYSESSRLLSAAREDCARAPVVPAVIAIAAATISAIAYFKG